MIIMIKYIDAFIDALFPPRCMLCDQIVTPDKHLCNECYPKIKQITGEICLGCARPIKRCECMRFIYHFDGIVSPFHNSDYAQKAFYAYKFHRARRNAKFYAGYMFKLLKQKFPDIKFDYITSVPPTKSKRKRNKYDHSMYLAKELSQKYFVTYRKLLTSCGDERQTQHKLEFSKRFSNVHNKYIATKKLKNKTILLVDDILTSGATIDECARQLKLAGAKAVFCVTALQSKGKTGC